MRPLSPAQRDRLTRWSTGEPGSLSHDGAASYCYRIVSVAEAVGYQVRGEWEVPDFQRTFVWNAQQILDLADSVMRGYPLGVILLWAGLPGPAASGQRTASGPERLLIADGLQRLASLCLMFGQRPAWWSDQDAGEWAAALARCDLRFNLQARKPPFFELAQEENARDLRLISLQRCLSISDAEVLGLACDIVSKGGCGGLQPDQILSRLNWVRAIRDRTLAAAVITSVPEDLLEIFERLTAGGLRFRRFLARIVLQSLPIRRAWVSSLLSAGAPSGRQAGTAPTHN